MDGKSKSQTRRDRIRKNRNQQQNTSRMIYIAGLIAVGAFIAYLISGANKPPADPVGISSEPMESSNHVEDGTDVDYSTNPPTSGPHYGQPMPAGFYNVGDVSAAFPESHIMHSMEHGYVVIWYNCSFLDAAGCDQLKSQIQSVLDSTGSQKVIVFPWNTINEPVVMTSWTWMLRFDAFDTDIAKDFIRENRSNPRAPEPNVP